MIKHADALQVIQLNEALKNCRIKLAQINNGTPTRGRIRIDILRKGASQYSDRGEEFTLEGADVDAMIMQKLRSYYEFRVAEYTRRLNALGAEILK